MSSPEIQTARNNEIAKLELTNNQILNVTQVSERITKILEEDPNQRTMFYESLKNDLIKTVISNPENVKRILDALNEKFEERLASGNIEPKDRINAIKNYTSIIYGIGEKITQASNNITGDIELKNAKSIFEAKELSLKTTYGNLIHALGGTIGIQNKSTTQPPN